MSLTITARPPTRQSATDTPPVDPVRAWLALLPSAELTPFTPTTVLSDTLQTPPEIAAASRAAACPDLFVVHAPDHAAGERVIVEVARVCGTSAGRVLVISPNPAAADRIAERFLRAGGIAIVRALAEDENPARPSPQVARVTSAAVMASTVERLKREAAAAIAAADARLTALERLTELTEKAAKLDAGIAEVSALREAVDGQVRGETDTPFTVRLEALKAAHNAATARLTADAATASGTRKGKEAALAALRTAHAELTSETTKKPGFFARLLGKGKHGADAAELEKQIQGLEAEIAALTGRVAALHTEIEATAGIRAAELEKAIQEEVRIRRGNFDSRLASLASDRDAVSTEIAGIGKTLGSNPPAANELAEVRYAATRDLVGARERAAEVNRTIVELARRSLAETRVVVGTPGSVYADAVFTQRDPTAWPPFSLMVLDRAEELAEPDFVQFAKLAERWILVGDAAPAEEPKSHLNGSHPRHGHTPAPGRNGRQTDAPFAARLARALDREMWVHEAERLVCRLAFPTLDQRRGMTREPLLDRPEIELRFVLDAGSEPRLAEVAFPAGTAVPSAKAFLFHQIGEVLLRPCGAVNWHHGQGAITACWSAAEHGNSPATWIELESGVREKVAGIGCAAFTAAVTFELSAGWDAEKAEAWLTEHLPGPSAGRFAAVPTAAPVPRRPITAS
jgi:hypothetical protein